MPRIGNFAWVRCVFVILERITHHSIARRNLGQIQMTSGLPCWHILGIERPVPSCRKVWVVAQSPERLGCHEPQSARAHVLSDVWPCIVPGSSVFMGWQIGELGREPGREPDQAADNDSGCPELLAPVRLVRIKLQINYLVPS